MPVEACSKKALVDAALTSLSLSCREYASNTVVLPRDHVVCTFNILREAAALLHASRLWASSLYLKLEYEARCNSRQQLTGARVGGAFASPN